MFFVHFLSASFYKIFSLPWYFSQQYLAPLWTFTTVRSCLPFSTATSDLQPVLNTLPSPHSSPTPGGPRGPAFGAHTPLPHHHSYTHTFVYFIQEPSQYLAYTWQWARYAAVTFVQWMGEQTSRCRPCSPGAFRLVGEVSLRAHRRWPSSATWVVQDKLQRSAEGWPLPALIRTEFWKEVAWGLCTGGWGGIWMLQVKGERSQVEGGH